MGFRGGGRRQRPPKPTRQQLAAQEKASDLAHGHGRRRVSDRAAMFDPPQLGGEEIAAGLRRAPAASIRDGSCRSATFPELEAQWTFVQNQWLWGVTLSGKPLESGWAGNRSLARQRAIAALGRQALQIDPAGHA